MLSTDRLDRYLTRALDSLDGPFAQLAFLASLRDPYTGRYLHEGWSGVLPQELVHEALRETHRRVFESVVASSLADLCNELRRHFQLLGEEEQRVAKLWLETEPYYELVPEGCSQLPRKFFITQIRTALEVLVRAPHWEFLREPVSSPLPQFDPPPQPRWPN
jgi:hypothetical protein